MSIHFYKKGDTKNALYLLSDDAYTQLESLFNEFHDRTGIYIDPYGDTRLYSDNFKLLKTIIGQKFNESDPVMQAFIGFIDKVIAEDWLVDAAGD